MLILGLESAGATASVALLQDGAPVGEYSLHHTLKHAETLLPMAERLMGELGVEPGKLSAIAVDHGPGSFTGVRIGVCAANGMGQALGIPVAGVCSLDALNEVVSAGEGAVCAMLDARNDSVYAAIYRAGECIAAPEALSVAQLLKKLPDGTLFTGDGAAVYAATIQKAVQGARFAPAHMALLRATAVCAVAERLLRQSGGGLIEAAPMYLRPSQAERLRQGQGGE